MGRCKPQRAWTILVKRAFAMQGSKNHSQQEQPLCKTQIRLQLT